MEKLFEEVYVWFGYVKGSWGICGVVEEGNQGAGGVA
jgi:hypothetical protein